MRKPSFYLVNAITLYRLMAAPVLVGLLLYEEINAFRWLLVLSFFTDMIDGSLARKYKVSSILGSRLDSLADDLTVAAGIAGLILLKPAFLREQLPLIIPLLLLFLVQVVMAHIRYGRFSSFHTRSAKLAALFQGVFLILVFFLNKPPLFLFYATILITAIDLVEEIILVILLPEWKTDVKGIFWVLKKGHTRD
jgi:phosphatidylglycerophosphate synthase